MILYIDCIGGVAGDMLLGALLDAGATVDLSAFDLEIERGTADRHGITAVDHDACTGAAEQPHRDWGDDPHADRRRRPARAGARRARRRRSSASRSPRARSTASTPERVHFHEVGAIDAIGEIVGVALALESLRHRPRRSARRCRWAAGSSKAAHGNLPLPAPATLELLQGRADPRRRAWTWSSSRRPAPRSSPRSPSRYGPLPRMTLARASATAPARATSRTFPNVVRAIIGTEATTGTVSLIEANLDDLLPELAPDAAAACFAAGALDVWTTPAQMKQRPPRLRASPPSPAPTDERAVIEAMLRETSTLGVRVAHLDRVELERDFVTVEVAGEPVRIKVGRLDGKVVNLAPEHADCERAARITGDAGQDRLGQAMSRGACMTQAVPEALHRSRAARRRRSSRSPAASTRPSSPRSPTARSATRPAPSRRSPRPSRSGELEGAQRVAAHIGIEHEIVRTNELARPGYRANGRDRCYFCKSELYDTLAARYPGVPLLSGANQDDQGDWRPGLKAAAEHDVVHPLDRREQGRGPRARPRAAAPERREARLTLPGEPHPLRHRRGPRDARPDRPRRAGRQSTRLPGASASAITAPRPPRGRDRGPRTARSQPSPASSPRSSAPATQHATIDLKPFRSGRLNVEPARPAASR